MRLGSASLQPAAKVEIFKKMREREIQSAVSEMLCSLCWGFAFYIFGYGLLIALCALVVFPPLVAEYANEGQGHEGEVKNAGIEGFCGFFAQLLGRFGTDGTLGRSRNCCRKRQ
jgi:hypothetical protein